MHQWVWGAGTVNLGEEKMKHFSLTEWADFARRVVGSDGKGAMQAHLDSGCTQCGEALRTWKRVREIARRERSYEPPESATRTVKSLLPIHGRPGKASLVRLLFDSFQSPATAGVRSTVTTYRQMLYGVGTYRIDLRMEPQMDSDRVLLVGQILNAVDPVKTGAQIPVTLLCGSRILAKSQTNALGEFHLECSLEGHLQLRLALPRARNVRIPVLVPSESAIPGLLESIDSKDINVIPVRKGRSTRKRV